MGQTHSRIWSILVSTTDIRLLCCNVSSYYQYSIGIIENSNIISQDGEMCEPKS